MQDKIDMGFLAGTIGTQHDKDELRDYVVEAAKRKIEAVRLYTPSPLQEQFHSCQSKIRIFQAGNQVGKACTLETPVLTPSGWLEMGDIEVGDTVIGGDGKPCKVTGVFPQGELPVFDVATNDGGCVTVCGEHLWKVQYQQDERRDEWRVVNTEEIARRIKKGPQYRPKIPRAVCDLDHQDVPVDPYVLGCLIGDASMTRDAVVMHTVDQEILTALVDSLPDSCELSEVSGERSVGWRVSRVDKRGGRTPNEFKQALKELGLIGKRSWEKFVPPEYLWNSVEVRLAVLQGLLDTDGHVDRRGRIEFVSSSEELARDVQFLVRSLGGKCSLHVKKDVFYTSPNSPERTRGRVAYRCNIRLDEFPLFRLERKLRRGTPGCRRKDRRICSITPSGTAECQCITVDSPDRTFVTQDFIVTHNSLAGFAELARAVTGTDPHGKYPKENGIAVVLGLDERHIGRVVHSYLFRSGRFRIIRDSETGEWRAWRPWDQDDIRRKDETKPAPPLIPQRYIKKMSWTKRASYIFDQVEFHNGWILYAMSSKGEPAGGFQADLAMIDEDIDRPDWYDELVARLSMRDGRLIWTALPLSKNDAMINALDQAEIEENEDVPTVKVFKATIFDNPYMEQKVKDDNVRTWKAQGDDVYRKRALGEMVTDSLLMYPTFSRNIHAAVKDFDEHKSPVQEFLTQRMGVPGEDWTRYMVVDPGHSVCAVTFWTVPPPEVFGDHRICYDELYLKNCTAEMFGENVERVAKNLPFEAFIIDAHGGRLKDLSTGITPRQQYEKQLLQRGVVCAQTGHRFIDGSDHIEGRENKLREWLSVKSDGTPTMYIVLERCRNFVQEFSRFRRKVINNVVQDEGNRRGMCHAIETAEYAAAHGLPYVKPQPKRKPSSVVQRVLAERKARELRRRSSIFSPQKESGVTLGPSGDKN